MTTLADLDVNQPIAIIFKELEQEIAKNGAPSPYFEELWHSLIVCLDEIDARLVAGGL